MATAAGADKTLDQNGLFECDTRDPFRGADDLVHEAIMNPKNLTEFTGILGYIADKKAADMADAFITSITEETEWLQEYHTRGFVA